MNYKKILSLIVPLTLVTGFASCHSDDDGVKGSNVTLKGVNGEEISGINVEAKDAYISFSVYSPVTPSVSTTQSWVSAEASEPSKMNSISKISLTIESNPTDQERTANINISASGSSITVKLTQAASEGKEDSPQNPTEEVEPSLGINANDISKAINSGWNIGNTLEVPGGETLWGNPKVNEAYVEGIKAAGFDAVRIPCAWDSYIIDKTNHTIDPVWLDRVNEVVSYVLARDMYAIVNIHWDGGWLENNIGTSATDALLTKQKALWTQIATRLGHYNEKLMFAGLNEPNAGNEWGNSSDNVSAMKALLDYEQAFVDAVRTVGGNNATRTLIVQAPHTSINMAYDYMDELPKDPSGDGYMMVEVHYYDPSDYTIMEEDGAWSPYVKFFWGADFHQGTNRDCSWGEEDSMLSQFQKMQEKFVSKGIPVVLGEYGAYPEDHFSKVNENFTSEEKSIIQSSREYWYKCLSKYTKETGLLPFVWDTGELINRNSGEIKTGKQYIIDALVN